MFPLDAVVSGASERTQQQQQRLGAMGARAAAAAAVHQPQVITRGLALPLEAGLVH